jgi:hypothetical protein
MLTIDESNRVTLIEDYVELIVNELTDGEIRSLLNDYIYDEKSKMSNVALIAEINATYPTLLEN